MLWQNCKRLKFQSLSNPGTLNPVASRSTAQGGNLDLQASVPLSAVYKTMTGTGEKKEKEEVATFTRWSNNNQVTSEH